MKHFLLIIAAWLLPTSAGAQLRLDFDADAYYDPPAATATAANDHAANITETSIEKARVIRHGDRTVRLVDATEPVTRLATANLHN